MGVEFVLHLSATLRIRGELWPNVCCPNQKNLALEGTFTLNVETLILIPTQASDDAFFAACQLQDEVQCAARLEPPKGEPVDANLKTYDADGYRTLWQNWLD